MHNVFWQDINGIKVNVKNDFSVCGSHMKMSV